MRYSLSTALVCWALSFGAMTVVSMAPSTADAAGRHASKPNQKAPAPNDDATVLAQAVAPPQPPPLPEIVSHFAAWVAASGDNEGLPFVVIDKVEAQVAVYGPDGQLTGSAPALLGFAPGDDSTPGIGDRELSNIPPQERTTPAGRFVAGFGPGPNGHQVLWVDYDTAISMHSLRQVILLDPKERRQQRLDSPTPLDNRITYGCINLPNAFFDSVVTPVFTGRDGIVYILPENHSFSEVFPTFGRELVAGPRTKPPRQRATARASHRAVPG